MCNSASTSNKPVLYLAIISGPANHLSFGDLLTENDALYVTGMDRRAPVSAFSCVTMCI